MVKRVVRAAENGKNYGCFVMRKFMESKKEIIDVLTRRTFITSAAAAIGSMTVPSASAQRSLKPSSFLELLRAPDAVTAYGSFEKTLPAGRIPLQAAGLQFSGGDVVVRYALQPEALVLTLAAPSRPIAVVHVRWRVEPLSGLRVLGDAWERSYGELGWRDLIPERVMPWYFATHDGTACHGYGVKTDAAALCFWQLDPEGVSLWLNVTNGGSGVELGSRTLTMATVMTRSGGEGENMVEAVSALCRKLCARAPRPFAPIYGSNDWNYSYGHSTAESILRDTEFIVELSPNGGVRPFSVIDDGYANATPAWPDMGKLAEQMKRSTARPGIWIRPLKAPPETAPGLLLPGVRFGAKTERAREFAYDPTIPEAQEKILAKLRQVTAWGFELVKHDFSTYELLGQWGFEMGPQPTVPGWSLHDRSRTNAEVIARLYAQLRETAGPQVLLEGCNTVTHLGQGIFDLQRTGDDTSGRLWERTRRMGVNTLAFRLPQHRTFHILDADIVGITENIPWELNRQWLEVLAHSGTTTIVAPGPPSRGPEQRAALREAFRIVAAGGLAARPLDWLETSTPERWQLAAKESRYRWSGEQGASPFLGG
jgi:alpha-galactosidase